MIQLHRAKRPRRSRNRQLIPIRRPAQHPGLRLSGSSAMTKNLCPTVPGHELPAAKGCAL